MGIRGDGKTWLSIALLREFLTVYPEHKVFISDPMNCYPLPDFHSVYTIEEAVDALINPEIRRIRYAMACPDDIETLFDLLKELDDIFIIIDESDQVFGRVNNSEALHWITHYGRHVNQAAILIARRPPSLPIDFTAQSIFCFSRVIEPNDIKYVKGRLGYEPPDPGQYNWYSVSVDGELTEIPSTWIAERN